MGIQGWPQFRGGFGVPGLAAGAPALSRSERAHTPLGLVTVETKLVQGGNAIPELIKVITASHQLLTRPKDLL